MAEIERNFKCNCKEVSISHNGISYLVICGKHINGAYCAFPKLNVAVELSGYDGDYGYNEKKLYLAFTDKEECLGNDIVVNGKDYIMLHKTLEQVLRRYIREQYTLDRIQSVIKEKH